MPDFFIYDTVRTKDGGIIGTVERTHLNNASDSFNVSEFPILCWVQVPEKVIYDFLDSQGTPPRGYVFVVAAEDSQGAFLAAEDDLELVSRSFDIGDTVKRRDGLLGTVIDVDDTYDIRQVIRPEGNRLKHFSQLGPEAAQYSIPDVPGRELKAAEEMQEDDFVSYRDWLGVVRDAPIAVVTQLEDNAIVLVTDDDFFVPISGDHKPLGVASDEWRFADSDSRFNGHPPVFPIAHPRVGSVVALSRSNLENGRWLNGHFKPEVSHYGRVIAVLTRRVSVDWITYNPFAYLLSGEESRPRTSFLVYENIGIFRRGDELRPLPNLKLIDLSLPTELPTTESESGDGSPKPIGINGMHPGLKVGDSVYFRDAARAAVKYPADGTNGRGFHHIDRSLTSGWDVNVFSVTSRKQMAKVRWYDGSESVVNSNEVFRFVSFEDDVRPCDIVVERAGLKMKILSQEQAAVPGSLADANSFVDFNEMKFFETPCHLKPQRVGVIQSVDADDRVASVRWYKNPELLIIEGGTALTQDSYFGPIGEEIEECSMYEIMKFPALSREYRDLVILPPQFILQACHQMIESAQSREMILGDISLYNGTKIDSKNIDWVGEIVALGLDGSITVRLSGARIPRDQTIDFDLVVANLNVDDLLASDSEDSDDSDMESDEVISESIEYEGGERMDDDPDDENWDHLPSERPPSFALLDIEPPADQYTVLSIPPSSSSAFLKRIRHEHRMLSTSLPPTIYVRGYESNLSLLRCLIIGPADTPYENAPFLIDLVLPPNYPAHPPKAHFHSWTSGLGRINPNLYEEGRICLSLLGTWPGESEEESWSDSATLLQLLVSIQGLIMVQRPFFNEAGLEDFANEPNSGYETESVQYNEKAYVMARRFVKHALTHTPAGIEDILAWLYFPPGEGDTPGLLQDVLSRGRAIISASKQARGHDSAAQLLNQSLLDGAGRPSPIEGFLQPLSRGAIVMLTRLLNELTDCLAETKRTNHTTVE
ncbi:hypothetical protein DV738_g3222, partial [Chaetothyriales sp. CBS 135597]